MRNAKANPIEQVKKTWHRPKRGAWSIMKRSRMYISQTLGSLDWLNNSKKEIVLKTINLDCKPTEVYMTADFGTIDEIAADSFSAQFYSSEYWFSAVNGIARIIEEKASDLDEFVRILTDCNLIKVTFWGEQDFPIACIPTNDESPYYDIADREITKGIRCFKQWKNSLDQ